MTKRRIERDLDALEEDLEDDIDPDDWLQVALRGFAEDREGWRERVYELCPQQTYTLSDPRYTGRLRSAHTLAKRAVHNLHTRVLEIEFHLLRSRFVRAIETLTDLDPADFGVLSRAEWVDQPSMLMGELYVFYISYERFAEEVLGVEFNTWLGVHEQGHAVVQWAAELLSEYDWQFNRAEAEINDADPLDWDPMDAECEDVVTLNALAEQEYQRLRGVWENAVEE